MARLAPVLRLLPFLLLALAGLAVWQETREAPPARPGPELPPELQLAPATSPPRAPPPVPPAGAKLAGGIELPDEICLGDPLAVTLRVENTGTTPLKNVVLLLPLPDGTHSRQRANSLRFTVAELPPGSSARREDPLIATRPGLLELRGHLRSAEGVTAQCDARVRIATAVLTLEQGAVAPATAESGPKICLVVTNHGGAPARDVWVRLLPAETGASPVHWPQLASGESRTACFTPLIIEATPQVLQGEASARSADVALLDLKLAIPLLHSPRSPSF